MKIMEETNPTTIRREMVVALKTAIDELQCSIERNSKTFKFQSEFSDGVNVANIEITLR